MTTSTETALYISSQHDIVERKYAMANGSKRVPQINSLRYAISSLISFILVLSVSDSIHSTIALPFLHQASTTNVVPASWDASDGIQGAPIVDDETSDGIQGALIADKTTHQHIVSSNDVTDDSMESTIAINLNKNSTVASDVTKFWHDGNEGTICIHFKADARCPRPGLRGRLSGPALAMLEWTIVRNDEPDEGLNVGLGTVFCGSYNNANLLAGTYFLEVLILYCNDFGEGALQWIKNETEWMQYDFEKDCLEDTDRNRITAADTYITIHSNYSTQKGHWEQQDSSVIHHTPLYTRYQPQGCWNSTKLDRRRPLPKWCGRHVSLPKHAYTYKFKWQSDLTNEDLNRTLHGYLNRTDLPKICSVGCSHSRYMVQNSLKDLGLSGLMTHIQIRYPNQRQIKKHILRENCDKLIIGVGQWSASYYGGKPDLFFMYYRALTRAVQSALNNLPSDSTSPSVYMLSIHQGPIMGRTGMCPPNDWRTPTVLNGYTSIAQKIVNEVKKDRNNDGKIQYLDTDFITSVMWDTDPDWQHLPSSVRESESLYVAATVLGEKT